MVAGCADSADQVLGRLGAPVGRRQFCFATIYTRRLGGAEREKLGVPAGMTEVNARRPSFCTQTHEGGNWYDWYTFAI